MARHMQGHLHHQAAYHVRNAPAVSRPPPTQPRAQPRHNASALGPPSQSKCTHPTGSTSTARSHGDDHCKQPPTYATLDRDDHQSLYVRLPDLPTCHPDKSSENYPHQLNSELLSEEHMCKSLNIDSPEKPRDQLSDEDIHSPQDTIHNQVMDDTDEHSMEDTNTFLEQTGLIRITSQ